MAPGQPAGERQPTVGPDRDFGQTFEAENAETDLSRWRTASDAEFGRVIAELMRHGERVAATTGIRNEQPAKRFPGQVAEEHGS